MTLQDTTHKTVTTTLNFKQMVNVLNLNIKKNNSLVGININILILSMTLIFVFQSLKLSFVCPPTVQNLSLSC